MFKLAKWLRCLKFYINWIVAHIRYYKFNLCKISLKIQPLILLWNYLFFSTGFFLPDAWISPIFCKSLKIPIFLFSYFFPLISLYFLAMMIIYVLLVVILNVSIVHLKVTIKIPSLYHWVTYIIQCFSGCFCIYTHLTTSSSYIIDESNTDLKNLCLNQMARASCYTFTQQKLGRFTASTFWNNNLQPNYIFSPLKTRRSRRF